jgi:hypothetical protein
MKINLLPKLKRDRLIKTTLYISAVVISLFAIGKVFNGLAVTVRGFNNLKSAINGN